MKYLIYILCLCSWQNFYAQKNRQIDSLKISQLVDSINRLIDQAVVQKNGAVLQKHYADDFMFTHGTGLIDNKQSWISYVTSAEANYLSRLHDSVTVELHKNVAILKGKLTVSSTVNMKPNAYVIKYFRLYVLRDKVWQLLSHHTYMELKIHGGNDQ